MSQSKRNLEHENFVLRKEVDEARDLVLIFCRRMSESQDMLNGDQIQDVPQWPKNMGSAPDWYWARVVL